MPLLTKLVLAADAVLKIALVLLMALLVCDVIWQVITRFLMASPSSFTEELSRFLLIWIGLLGSALAYREGMHLGLDIATKDLTGKKKLVADLTVHILVMIFAIFVMIVGGSNLVSLTLLLNQVSASMGILMGYIYVVIPLSGGLIVLYAVDFIAKDLRSFNNDAASAAQHQ